MDKGTKTILTRGLELSSKRRSDLIFSKQYAPDCSNKKDSYISLSFDITTYELTVNIDDSNRPTMDGVIDIKVLVDSEIVTEENDFIGAYTTKLTIGEFPNSISKDIIIAVNSSDKEVGCVFEYHLEADPTTDLIVSNNNNVHSISLEQNSNSEIPIEIGEISPTFMLNDAIYPTGTELTNARARQLVENSTGVVTVDINGLILTAPTFSIDQSVRSIIVEQQNVVNGLKQYINFYTTTQISVPYYVSYYIDGNIHNEDYIEYDLSLVGKTITAVARPDGQPVIGNLDTTLSSIENYYDFSNFIVQEVDLFSYYTKYGYNEIDGRNISNTNGIVTPVDVYKQPNFTLDDIVNYKLPDVGTIIETESQSVLLNEPVIWETIDTNTGDVLNVKSFDRYGRERTEQMNQLVHKTIEVFSEEHLYKYDSETKYTTDSIAVFEGYSQSLVHFENSQISLKNDNTSITLQAETDSDILAISGIVTFNGLTSTNGSEIKIELYRDNVFVDRAGFRRSGVSTEILYDENSYTLTFDKYHSNSFNFDYRTSEIKPNIIKIYMNRQYGDIFSLSDLELTKRI